MYKGFICIYKDEYFNTIYNRKMENENNAYIQVSNIGSIKETEFGCSITLGHGYGFNVTLSVEEVMARIEKANS